MTLMMLVSLSFDQDYLSFGGDLEPLNDVDEGYKYTGQREEVSTGLYYYGARYYDPEIARFITEDIYPGELENSQSQNLYIYTMNNPLRYVDPRCRERRWRWFFPMVG